ncbi:MAG: hypothetical protein P4M13_01095 [Alphaproteobacteria bacterium]|nr:hypothetical protein [Alphaproteobacteria bacterium]
MALRCPKAFSCSLPDWGQKGKDAENPPSAFCKRRLQKRKKELRRQGCRQICVATESFQAPDFYRKSGYRLAATMPQYNNGHEQLIFRKLLRQETETTA